MIFPPELSERAAARYRAQGGVAEVAVIDGDGGHLDGVLAVAKQGEAIRAFLGKVAGAPPHPSAPTRPPGRPKGAGPAASLDGQCRGRLGALAARRGSQPRVVDPRFAGPSPTQRPRRGRHAKRVGGITHARDSSAATAGSVFPSRNSRNAPPPVEM